MARLRMRILRTLFQQPLNLEARAECRYVRLVVFNRTYATHRDPATTSSLLSQALDQKQRAARRNDSVGPFQLGLIPPAPQDVGEVKKWSELSTSGKVIRSTARTTNLAVILFGAGLSAVLIYALTSELFSKNSPTVLYGEACQMIKASPRVAKYLQGPLIFHNNPPASIRPRHRNRHLSSQLAVDSSGREHMLLNFYVQGSPPGSTPTNNEDSYVEKAVQWTKKTANELSEMSFDEFVENATEQANHALDACIRMFKFLSGDPVPSTQLPTLPSPEVKEEQKAGGWVSGFTGLFSGLKGTARTSTESLEDTTHIPTDTEGEVHADLVMNGDGYFEFRYLLIDIPNSHARNPKRIFVARSDGVRETERVMRWHR